MASQLYAYDIQESSSRPFSLLTSDLIADAGRMFPDLSGTEIGTVAREVEQEYLERGPRLIWTVVDGLPTYKCPIVCKLPAESWALHERTGGWSIKVVFASRMWVLRLDETRARRVQPGLRRLMRYPKRGPLEIYEDARSAAAGGSSAGRQRTGVMVRVVAPDRISAGINRY